MPRLSLSLLGSFQATLDGRPITGFESDRVRALLTYLAVEAGRPHRRETLVGLLWPDWPEPSASSNLRNALSNLRKAIGDRETAVPALLVDRETIQFNPAGDAWVDVHAFDTLTCLEQPARWEEGLALYRGPFLEGFSLKDSAAFEEWVTATREQLERRCLAALARLAEHRESEGDLARACEVAWHAVDLAPWQEESHRRLMRLLAVSDQRSAALTQYETCRHLLQRELGVEPAAETTRLYEQIRDGVVTSRGERVGRCGGRSGGADDALSPAPLLPLSPSPLPNLPTWLTPFVGREDLLAEVRQQILAPACRLLTLVGPGGSGKTRLAVEAASGITATFPQGVYFVALAAVQSPEGIVPAIGQALGFPFREREDPHQQLLSYLRAKTLLLILDNCEHLLTHADAPRTDSAGVAVVVCGIVQAAPGVKLLVTSRTSLNIEGEQLLPVAGMGLPEGSRTSLAEALESSAVQLFVQAAQRGQPAFRLTDDNLTQVLAICRRVAGLPLGIVLAAAWLRLLSPAEIVAELEGQGLDFLETDRGDAPERQRSLRAAFDYSWRLLNQRERDVLAGLAVFRGGAAYVAAHEVTGATLRDLRGLINASLVERTPAGRYVLHELLRQYAEEKLDATADGGQAVRDRHAAYYAAALARWTSEIKGLRQYDALAEMDDEFGDVQAAWNWAIERRQTELLAEAMEGFGLFCKWRARPQEGEAIFRALADALAVSGLAQPAGRQKMWALALAFQAVFGALTGKAELLADLARRSHVLMEKAALAGEDVRREQALALGLLGEMGWMTGDIEGHRELANASLALYRALDDRWGMAQALASLAALTHYVGDYKAAIRCRRESVEIFRALGALGDATAQQSELGMSLFYSGRIQDAEPLQVEAVATWRKLRQLAPLSDALYFLAKTLRGLGRYAESLAALEECLAIADEQGFSFRLGFALKDLGAVNLRLGRFDQARAFLDKSLAFFREIKHPSMAAIVALLLGEVALYENKPAEAYLVLAENVLVLRKLNYHAVISWTIAALAMAALELGRRDEAREKLSEALRIGVTRHDLSTVLCTLAGAALLLAAEGNNERAVELYNVAARYPILGEAPQLKLYAGERMPAIIAGMPADVVVAAQARGLAAEPFAAAEALLAEWGG